MLRDFGVHFDVHHLGAGASTTAAQVGGALALLAERGLTFEQDGALWLRTTDFGDDQDRVLRKSDGTYTYFVPDIAYHVDKHDRGFDRVIDVWGADHHGYIPRMRGGARRRWGIRRSSSTSTLVQLVKVVRGGEEVKMSKRSGEFVTLRDLFDEVGVDAARYFFLMRRGDSHLVFDVDLAKSQTDENPVFYVQMAHARMSGIFRAAEIEPDVGRGRCVDLAALPAPQDTELLKKLTPFPEVVAGAAREREPHRVTGYLEELARHGARLVSPAAVSLGEPPAVEAARLVLARAARHRARPTASRLLGLTAPDRM